MAKKAKKVEIDKELRLEKVNPNAAGIDIASGEMQVCVPPDRDANYNRRFGSFTCNLKEISAFLKACQIDTVAMESTGIYWLPLYQLLKEDGFDVILVNARDVKNISDKKTDKSDAEWIMLLHSYGILKAGFQPENTARSIRNLSRHRNNILKDSSKAIQHMQKAMEQMNIKLTNVLSDITGKSGMAMIKAILNGNHCAKSLANLADPRCKAKPEDIESSLEGTWDVDHLFELKQSLALYEFLQLQANECDREIEKLMTQYAATIDIDKAEFIPSNKRISKKNAVSFNVEKYAFNIWGVNAMNIPGMSRGALLSLIGELGHNFTEKFNSYKQFCKWLNLVPNNKISGGKLLSSKVPKRKVIAGQVFRQCANSVKDSKNMMGYYFRRCKAKDGHLHAILCTAHKIAKIFYTMIIGKTEFDEKKSAIDEQELLQKKIFRAQIALDKLNAKLNKST